MEVHVKVHMKIQGPKNGGHNPHRGQKVLKLQVGVRARIQGLESGGESLCGNQRVLKLQVGIYMGV